MWFVELMIVGETVEKVTFCDIFVELTILVDCLRLIGEVGVAMEALLKE